MTSSNVPTLTVNVPITNLRSAPTAANFQLAKDSDQESQCVLGERVRLLRQEEEWSYVETLDQSTYKEGEIIPYPGWILSKDLVEIEKYPKGIKLITREPAISLRYTPHSSSKKIATLSLGSQLTGEAKGDWWRVTLPNGTIGYLPNQSAAQIGTLQPKRREIIATASKFLASHYLWGGRSAQEVSFDNTPGGVDCSALVQLACLANGLNLPRNASDQYRACSPSALDTLLPADLIFFANPNTPKRIHHVAIWLKNGLILESSQSKHGVLVSQLSSYMERYTISYGRLPIQD